MYKKIDLEKLIVIDIETICNSFVANCLDYKTGSKKSFVFFDAPEYENQPLEFFKFLKSCVKNNYTFITFNGINFDQQILHYFYEWCCEKRDPLYEMGSPYIIEKLYEKAQELINCEDKDRFEISVPENKFFLPVIDMYKQLHYDRPAKATSLKWVEFSMRFHTIQEMPIAHDEEITKNDIESVVDYCWNDVIATKEFFDKVKYETEVRLDLSKEFDLNLINASEPKMVREIFGKFLCEEMKISYKELKTLKTFRKEIKFKDIILPYIQFQSKGFKDVFDIFYNTIIDASPNVKSNFSYSFPFQGMKIDLGMGGIHACNKSGIYTHSDDECIEDADGKSFYPFLAIKNNFHPAHLGDAFNKVYPMMYEKRCQYNKKDPINYIFKIILNACFGLSKEINGYLYDPLMMFSITIAGQLSLLMLAEALYLSIPDIEFIQMNTDGITYKYNKKYINNVRKVCSWWENVTKIELEYAYYQKMIIQDVNNYCSIKEGFDETKDPKEYIKKKGLFETEMPFHKNPSALIIPKALEQYFVYNNYIPEFILNPENSVFDYCIGVKKKSNFKLNLVQNFNFAELITEQQKVCRFIISKQTKYSGALYKDFNDGRRISIMANKLVQPLDIINKEHEKCNEYPIDFQYYINETNKIINQISPSVIQKELF